MRLDLSQQMKMDQRMMLAPRMIQSMEILQLPLMALQERIEQEMTTNPMLELEDQLPDTFEREAAPGQNQEETEVSEVEQDLKIEENNSKSKDFERLNNLGDDYNDYLERNSYVHPKPVYEERDRKLEAMQNTAAPSQSLSDYLHEQWAFVECEPIIKKIGTVMIDFIEESGYLLVEMNLIRDNVREKTTPRQLEETLRLVQTLDPPGVAARNLVECLLLQIQNSDEDRSLEIEIISKHIKDIEMNRYPVIARKTRRTIAEIKEAINNISRLDPHPGMQIGEHTTPYIIPDIIVEYNEDNDIYHARLTEGSTPNLRINPQYNNMLKDRTVETKTRQFLQDNARSARWLIESIAQRKSTLMRVVNHVLKSQRGFFDSGPLHLKPLPMVEVADVLNIHVGTVSRAVSGKYMQTPNGIYPLRYFFSGGTETTSGQSVSWDAVKAKLREIVENEDKNNPLNDDDLVKEMKKHGFTLARRTVAKYRSLLNLPPARRRKEFV